MCCVPATRGGAHPIVSNKWIYKVKRDANVAKASFQEHDLDYHELFSPVVFYGSLHVPIALTAYHRWRPQQLDKGSFPIQYPHRGNYLQLPESNHRGRGSYITILCMNIPSTSFLGHSYSVSFGIVWLVSYTFSRILSSNHIFSEYPSLHLKLLS